MEKEYIEVILSDLKKPRSVEDKINLITVFMTELAKSNAENKKDISEIKDTLLLNAEAFKSIGKSLDSITTKFTELERVLQSLLSNANVTAEGAAKSAQLVLNLINGSTETWGMISKINTMTDLVIKRIEVLESK